MPRRFRDEDADVWFSGGGINSRASEDQIAELECTEGENFLLDPGNAEFRPRPPIELVGTTPNATEIRGFATLLKTDGTVTMLVQAGATVYSWDGNTFDNVGTVSASAKLRGPKHAIWALADKVLIADINLADEIHEWDGTTFAQSTFLQSDGSSAFGAFRCKHIMVDNERTFYGNIHDNGSNFPHLLVVSERGDYKVVSSSDRPADALGADAPFFIPMPQLKPINGIAEAFGVIAFSQSNGDFEYLTGETSKNYALKKLHSGSGASGDEAVVSTTNDIIYGAPGHIESLQSTDKFGDVEFDDVSFKIQPAIKTYKDWTLIFNQRLKRLYCFPDGTSEVWVLHTDFIGSELSGWSKYTTEHAFSFQPSAAMTCYDPADGLEYVFMGDSSGNLYRMEGASYSGDAGSASVVARRKSKLYDQKLDAEGFNIVGFLEHRKKLVNNVNLTFEFSGYSVNNVRKTVPLSTLVFDAPYSGPVYYGGPHNYGVSQENKLVRKKYAVPGKSSQWQIEAKVEGINDFAVTKIGFRNDIEG